MSRLEGDALEELLRHAEPRPVPGSEEMASAKVTVRDEWLEVTGRRNSRRRAMGFAVAAVLVIGVFAAFNALRTPVVDIVQVATIEKSFGPVYLLEEQAELRPTVGLANVVSGQTIVTGDGAGLALAWSRGGSVRVDQNSRIRFTNEQELVLDDGRIYFDSTSLLTAGTDAGDAPAFSVLTKFGDVRHVGTQYMAEVESTGLIVSVREGKVSVEGRHHDQTISAGQQATFAGQRRPSILSISGNGQAWDWVERTTPAVDVDGKTLNQFLVWVCREMGLELRFEGDAESIAHEAILKGTINTEPAEALRLRLATAALNWRIEGGVIYISD